jgi:hypothetical protein
MTKQLTLIDSPASVHPAPVHDGAWQLDERTREVGRRGIAAARAAIRLARGVGQDHATDQVDIVDPAA